MLSGNGIINVTEHDIRILQDLARYQVEIACSPEMEQRRKLWLKHNSLEGERPIIIFESGGVRNELIPASSLVCEEEWARNMELEFRLRIYQYENIKDDSVIDPYINIGWLVDMGDYGVPVIEERAADSAGRKLGTRWKPPIKDISGDFSRLRHRQFCVDRAGTLSYKARLQEIFKDIMTVRIRGGYWWTMGLTWEAIKLVGLENFMIFMLDDPEGMHKLMAFLRDDHIDMVEWFEKEGLLSLNNENDYIGSGSYGFTSELPKPDYSKGGMIRPKDLWALFEAQETVGISPEMFAEFVLPYQLEIAERFGLIYYGCCEPLDKRWEYIEKFKNLHSISISPWCNQQYMANVLGDRYIFSRKPKPTMVSMSTFDEDEVRKDIEYTLHTARNCKIELIMKDVHTLGNEPWRAGRWVELARGAIEKVW